MPVVYHRVSKLCLLCTKVHVVQVVQYKSMQKNSPTSCYFCNINNPKFSKTLLYASVMLMTNNHIWQFRIFLLHSVHDTDDPTTILYSKKLGRIKTIGSLVEKT